jgi:hypothetical protein
LIKTTLLASGGRKGAEDIALARDIAFALAVADLADCSFVIDRTRAGIMGCGGGFRL